MVPQKPGAGTIFPHFAIVGEQLDRIYEVCALVGMYLFTDEVPSQVPNASNFFPRH